VCVTCHTGERVIVWTEEHTTTQFLIPRRASSPKCTLAKRIAVDFCYVQTLVKIVSDIAVFLLKRDVKLQLTNPSQNSKVVIV